MERPRHFEDYALGEVRRTGGRTITETDFVVHAGHTGDFFPHHMDAEFMKGSEFGQRIAHGTMTFAIGIGLTATEINPLAFTYGYERLRFPRPVFIGDTIRIKVTIADKRPHKQQDKGIVAEKIEVFNQHGQPVLVCEHLLLVNRKKA